MHGDVEQAQAALDQRRAELADMRARIESDVRMSKKGACEMLGLDPLYVANEGKLVAIVAPDAADRVLAAMRRHPLGAEARIIGTVTASHPRWATMRTAVGPTRIVDMLAGDQLPRICRGR